MDELLLPEQEMWILVLTIQMSAVWGALCRDWNGLNNYLHECVSDLACAYQYPT